jgi:tRNA pseudouridine55 synthase
MRDGILLIDKPAGMSSAGVVARVKRGLGATRVGHAGTLDPDATGLLIIVLQGATRVASYASDGFKVYSGVIQLGVTTTTDDLSGEILSRGEPCQEWGDIERAVSALRGQISQVPPQVSAKKLDGKRAYKLHRQGHTFELEARSVEVRRFEVAKGETPGAIQYCVEVSPGTYVRALARDLGQALGCGAAVESIRRESSGCFAVTDAVDLSEVSWAHVRDWGTLVPEMPRVYLPHDVVRGLAQGQRDALNEAWTQWQQLRVEAQPEHVVYLAEGREESLGILKVLPEGSFAFQLNVTRV